MARNRRILHIPMEWMNERSRTAGNPSICNIYVKDRDLHWKLYNSEMKIYTYYTMRDFWQFCYTQKMTTWNNCFTPFCVPLMVGQ
jgi:hypothetical protein